MKYMKLGRGEGKKEGGRKGRKEIPRIKVEANPGENPASPYPEPGARVMPLVPEFPTAFCLPLCVRFILTWTLCTRDAFCASQTSMFRAHNPRKK